MNQENKLIADSRNPQYVVHNRILYPNGSLEIANIKLDDTGDYVCEVTVGSRVFKQQNSIEVQGTNFRSINKSCWLIDWLPFNNIVEPEVITFPSGTMNVTLGAMFQITCEPKG